MTTVEVGGFPTQMALSPDGTRAYVVDRRDVLMICTVTEQIVGAVRVDSLSSALRASGSSLPSCVTASPDGGRLYIADYTGGVRVVGVAPAETVPLFQAIAMQLPAAPEVRELEPAV
jgi:DNA-binding beta-propeller fold protein YncE